VEAREGFALRVLSHSRSKGMMRWFQRWSLRQKRKRLIRLIKLNPPLRTIYEDKLRELDSFELAVRDRTAKGELGDEVEEILDAMEEALGERKWLAGERYSVADLAWTPVLSKLEHIGFARSLSERRRPNVARWFRQLRNRGSWDAMLRRLTPMQVARFYGPAVAKSLAVVWLIKWALVFAIGWLIAHL
jgi:glutathione S-transferase